MVPSSRYKGKKFYSWVVCCSFYPLDCCYSDSARLTGVSATSWTRGENYFVWAYTWRSAVFNFSVEPHLPLSFLLSESTVGKMNNRNKCKDAGWWKRSTSSTLRWPTMPKKLSMWQHSQLPSCVPWVQQHHLLLFNCCSFLTNSLLKQSRGMLKSWTPMRNQHLLQPNIKTHIWTKRSPWSLMFKLKERRFTWKSTTHHYTGEKEVWRETQNVKKSEWKCKVEINTGGNKKENWKRIKSFTIKKMPIFILSLLMPVQVWE